VQEAVTVTKTVPASYKTVKVKVVDKPAHTIWKKGKGLITKVTKIDEETGEIVCLVEVPPTYKTITKRVLDKPERVEKVVVTQAKYKMVRTRVLKRPATTRTIKIPAKYKTVRKKVLKKPAQTRTVKIPAQYKNVRKRVLKRPAQTRTVPTPPEYQTVRKKVLKRPAETRKVDIPAQYKTIKVKVLSVPAQTREIPVPAKYGVVTTQNPLTESKTEWRTVLCETNMTGDNIKSMQRALKRAGFNPGTIDGVLGSQTEKAVERYQRTHRLSRGGITTEVLKALGVKVTK